MKRRKFISIFLTILSLFLMLVPEAKALAQAGISGAIFTTDKTGNDVNKNLYEKMKDVYLNGGPENPNAAGLPDGNYYARITSPGGEVLGKSDTAFIEVAGGKFKLVYNLWDNLKTASSGFTATGYDFTPNPGDEYKVWICMNGTYDENLSKTDNFKVKEGPCPKIDLIKTASPDSVMAGEIVNYTFTIKNTGNVTLTGIVLADTKLEEPLVLPKTTLAPGESMNVTFPYTVPADTPPGKLTNKAEVMGYYGETKVCAEACADVCIKAPCPAIKLDKTVTPDCVPAGGSVTYTFTITNIGDVPLTGIKLEDTLLGGLIALPKTTLAPGESTGTSVIYTVPADIKVPVLKNLAIATGHYGLKAVCDTACAYVKIVLPCPNIHLKKTVTPDCIQAGGNVTYKFVITNTGNVPLTGITLYDSLLGGPLALEKTTLAPGESTDLDVEYTVPADTPPGILENHAIATGHFGECKVISKDCAVVKVTESPAIDLEKTVDKATVIGGGTVTYTYKIKNTGNTTLTCITLTDDMLGVIDLPVTTLLPGQSTTATKEYAIAPDASGVIQNNAEVIGHYPCGVVKDKDSAQVTAIPAQPAIDIEKTVNKGSASPGDTVTYSFKVTNTGNVGLTDVVITDPHFGASWHIDIGNMAPGQVVTFSQNYVIPETEESQLKNTAKATGKYGGILVEDKDDCTVKIIHDELPNTGVTAQPEILAFCLGMILLAAGLLMKFRKRA
jgi:uncharacterized repeat protein (TIGR01451 family)